MVKSEAMSSEQKLSMAFQLLRDAEEKIATARHLLETDSGLPTTTGRPKQNFTDAHGLKENENARIIEGVFDGQSMIGEDKKIYPIPANYASKSKLVEGDTLKLTIVEDGGFIFKQIGPVERKHVRGVLHKDARGECIVKVDKKDYKVLLASVTYFKGMPDDEITLVLPKSGQATWGAIENVIKTADDSVPSLVKSSMSKLQKEHEKAEAAVDTYDEADEKSIPIEGETTKSQKTTLPEE